MVKTVVAVKRGSVIAEDPAKRGRVEIIDLPARELGEEDVRIRVAYCGICGVDPRMVGGHSIARLLLAWGTRSQGRSWPWDPRPTAGISRWATGWRGTSSTTAAPASTA